MQERTTLKGLAQTIEAARKSTAAPMSDGDPLVRWTLNDTLCELRPNTQGRPWCLDHVMSRQSTGEFVVFDWNARYPDNLIQAAPDRLDDPERSERPLLISFSQGIGDFVQMMRYLRAPQLASRRLLLECPAPLRTLVEHQGLDVELVEQGALRGDPAVDEVAMMRLDQWLDDPYGSRPYLNAPGKPKKRNGKRPRIGLNWSAKAGTIGMAAKSVTPALLEALVAPRDDIDWVSVQFGQAEEALKDFPWAAGIELRGHTIDTVMRLTAEIADLDLLISIDSAPAHLAGALGVPVWLLLGPACAWRWRLVRPWSHLYGSMALFRTTPEGGWPELMRQVGEAIDAGAAPGGAPAGIGPAAHDSPPDIGVLTQFVDDPLGTLRTNGTPIGPDDASGLAGVYQLLVKCYGGFSWCVEAPTPDP